jgi:hypothetical protein
MVREISICTSSYSVIGPTVYRLDESELGECRFVCETVRKVAVQWPARGGRLGCQQIESSRKCSYRLFHSSNVSSSNKRNNAAETSITKLAISICDAYLYSDL